MAATSLQPPESRFLSVRGKILLGFGLAIAGVLATTAVAYRSNQDLLRTAQWIERRPLHSSGELLESEPSEGMSPFQKWAREDAGTPVEMARTTRRLLLLSAGFTLPALCGAVGLALWYIGARRRAEELLAQERNLLRHLIDTMPEQIYVKDLEGRFVLDNVAHRRFLGLQTLAEVVGKDVFSFFPKELATLDDADDRRVIATQTPVLNREEPVVIPEGRLTWLSITKVPLCDGEERPIGLLCVSSDISERKAAEERMQVFASQLEQSNRELRDFAGVASHDLQEPLRKIQAFAGRLRGRCGEALGPPGRDYLDRIESAAGRMQTLIQDLLVLSRVSSDAKRFMPADLGTIVHGVLSDLEVRIEQTGARIEIGYLPTIEADPVQMRQLFQNLLSNALKFQKPGVPPEIVISSKMLEVQDYHLSGAVPGDEVCQIMVKDNGIGFEEQFAEQIFALFQRLHPQGEYQGTGIGLAVCRKIATRHGGSITAKSAKGQGATFIVMLPVKQHTPAARREGGENR